MFVDAFCISLHCFSRWIVCLLRLKGILVQPDWPQEANNMPMITAFNALKYTFLKHFQGTSMWWTLLNDVEKLLFLGQNCTNNTSFWLILFIASLINDASFFLSLFRCILELRCCFCGLYLHCTHTQSLTNSNMKINDCGKMLRPCLPLHRRILVNKTYSIQQKIRLKPLLKLQTFAIFRLKHCWSFC